MNIDKLLTVPDVAEMLGVQKDTIYLWLRTKGLPHFKLGGRIIRFEPKLLSDWIAAQKEAVNG